jgi:putative FmdB family regulatory protein
MPIYEYECAGCGHRLEAIQRFSDAPLKKCPDCGRARLKKLISAAGFRLSGKGWYETDFKNNKQKNLAQKDSVEEKKPSKSGDTAGGEQKSGKSEGKKTTETKPAKSGTAAASAAGS